MLTATTRFSFLLCALMLTATAGAYEETLQPVENADGMFETVNIGGTDYYRVLDWQDAPAPYLYFDVSNDFPRSGDAVYLLVRWRESGLGELHVQYDSYTASATSTIEQSYWHAEERYGFRSFDRDVDRNAVFRLEYPQFAGRQNGNADMRIYAALSGGRLTVRDAVLSTEPPAEYIEAAAKPWLGPYEGPSYDYVDATSLDSKILCGYQGWFACPGDGGDRGYRHWSRDPYRLTPETLIVDMWPDVTEYDPANLHEVPALLHEGGKPAKVYSAFCKGPILTHFRWMREYGIDGIFLSRFVGETLFDDSRRHINQVLASVREAANREGRVWAMMLDATLGPEHAQTSVIINDWKFLVDEAKITEDPRYLHHNGKPVVLLWGFGFTDRPWTTAQAREVIDFFQNDPDYGGVYLIGGVPSYWRTLGPDSRKGTEWAAVYRSFDAVSPWAAGRYWNKQTLLQYRDAVWAGDLSETESLRMGYMPAAFPGFSWDNLQNLTPGTSLIPRDEGRFLWRQFYEQQQLGVRTTFVGMFDEVDEGTAIFKVTNDPPENAHFVTYDPVPPDYYLKLTGTATLMLRGEIPRTLDIPDPMPFPIEDKMRGNVVK